MNTEHVSILILIKQTEEILQTEVLSMEPTETNSIPQFLNVSIILSTPLYVFCMIE
jgi:hypothetical protein